MVLAVSKERMPRVTEEGEEDLSRQKRLRVLMWVVLVLTPESQAMVVCMTISGGDGPGLGLR